MLPSFGSGWSWTRWRSWTPTMASGSSALSNVMPRPRRRWGESEAMMMPWTMLHGGERDRFISGLERLMGLRMTICRMHSRRKLLALLLLLPTLLALVICKRRRQCDIYPTSRCCQEDLLTYRKSCHLFWPHRHQIVTRTTKKRPSWPFGRLWTYLRRSEKLCRAYLGAPLRKMSSMSTSTCRTLVTLPKSTSTTPPSSARSCRHRGLAWRLAKVLCPVGGG
mmetsp:Transcript_34521/g.101453  ORF Transcript_34521/g.101453 Transcript_34521/m.101453 type:complete len:222 (+) Transcript_34521:287-952(+)